MEKAGVGSAISSIAVVACGLIARSGKPIHRVQANGSIQATDQQITPLNVNPT